MLKEYLKKQEDSTLWKILADISAINADKNKASEFWLTLAGEVNEEINKRLFADYEGVKEL